MNTTPEAVLSLLSGYTFTFTGERELQDRIDIVLGTSGMEFTREHVLSPKDRIDFLVGGVGIEVKIGGSSTGLIRQIHRYVQHDAVQSLVVVVGAARLAQLPAVVNGKRVLIFDAVGRLW